MFDFLRTRAAIDLLRPRLSSDLTCRIRLVRSVLEYLQRDLLRMF